MLKHRMTYVTGLPRAGSTLLCQLLGMHPEVFSSGHSSPLAHALQKLRYNLSDDPFLLAQLDVDFDAVYERLMGAYRGFVDGWYGSVEEPVVIDKNRAWLNMADTVNHLDPDFRMLVCIRDPAQIYGSVEAQHQKTLLIDFPDHLANHSRYDRGDALFKNSGVIGKPLKALLAVQDLPASLRERIYHVKFERLVQDPAATMADIYRWLGLAVPELDYGQLPVKPHESDSHYRFKYTHRTHGSIRAPERHQIPRRIEADILKGYRWFYERFYPERKGSS